MGASSESDNLSAKSEDLSVSRVPQTTSRVYRFGPYELKTETGELWKQGTRIKLQAKSLQILETLLAKPGQLVTREELCKKLWPSDTFVDFESGLNTAINRVRVALSDSADAARYVETLPRLGYRFICPVTEVEYKPPERVTLITRPDVAPSEHRAQQVASEPPAVPNDGSAAGKRPNTFLRVAVMALAIIACLLGYHYLKPLALRYHPVYHQVTFRPGNVPWGRFTPDRQGIVYTARWGTEKRQDFLARLDGGDSEALQLPPGSVSSISPKGDVAFASRDDSQPDRPFRLSRVSLKGGPPEVLARGANAGDWDPQGKDFALLRREGSYSIIEFPAGNVLYRFSGCISSLRVSPKGDQIAFLEHPIRDDDAGDVRIVARNGATRALTGIWNSTDGLAWSPSGDEIWFTASKNGSYRSLYAVSLSGRLRRLSDSPSSLRILDVSKAGRALVAADDIRMDMAGVLAGEREENDFSKLDLSHADDLSADGRLLLFTESGEGGGQHYSAYVRDARLNKTFLVGSGRGLAISPDSKWVLTIDPLERGTLVLRNLESHEAKRVFGGGFQYQWARFLPGDNRLLVGGSHANQPLIICTQPVTGGKPEVLEGIPYMDHVASSVDGSQIAGVARDQIMTFDRKTGTIQTLPCAFMAIPLRWTADGRFLYVTKVGESDTSIVRVDIRTGASELWKKLGSPRVPGALCAIVAAPESGAYAYSMCVKLSRLYVVDGWS
jgi:eukaryotic-like serine/threonine-protein kinase